MCLVFDHGVSDPNPLRMRGVSSRLQFQALESRGVVTSRGRTWTLLDKQRALPCPKI